MKKLLLLPLLGLVLGPVQAHGPRHEDLALLLEGLVGVRGPIFVRVKF